MTSSPLETEPTLGPGRTLTIREIKTTALIVPLDQEYRGSYYRMTNRATIITRVVTEEGIVGEAYVGDEDKTLGEIVAIIHRRDRAAADRRERVRLRALLGARLTR